MNNNKTESAAECVLAWVEETIDKQGLQPGDSLPAEMEIAEAVGVGRSSVREALTALKALGIIRTRRKGGITIIREPILLKLRPFFLENYESRETLNTSKEFRSMLEWGAAEQSFHQIKKQAVKKLRKIINRIKDQRNEKPNIFEAEKEFHTLLLNGSKNQLAELMAFILKPVFGASIETSPQNLPKECDLWVSQHEGIVEALEKKDKEKFLKLMGDHTRPYLQI